MAKHTDSKRTDSNRARTSSIRTARAVKYGAHAVTRAGHARKGL